MLQTAKTARRLQRGEDLTVDPEEDNGFEPANGRTNSLADAGVSSQIRTAE
jgi:hypothetical protein